MVRYLERHGIGTITHNNFKVQHTVHRRRVHPAAGRPPYAERERRREEMKAEKWAEREKKMEEHRRELESWSDQQSPTEDMSLTDHKTLPDIPSRSGKSNLITSSLVTS